MQQQDVDGQAFDGSKFSLDGHEKLTEGTPKSRSLDTWTCRVKWVVL